MSCTDEETVQKMTYLPMKLAGHPRHPSINFCNISEAETKMGVNVLNILPLDIYFFYLVVGKEVAVVVIFLQKRQIYSYLRL